MSKVKLAVIRGIARPCPFGLPITQACSHAGDSINRMAPLNVAETEDQEERIKSANTLVYIHHKTGKKCPFSDKILDKYDKVDCDWGDTGEGQPHVPYRGSPLYQQTFRGVGVDGLDSFPLGFYDDGESLMRNMPFGIFSLIGSKVESKLIKLADKYDEDGDKERANIIDGILRSIGCITNKDQFNSKIKNIESFLQEYNEKNNIDAEALFKLSERWFGPKQTSR